MRSRNRRSPIRTPSVGTVAAKHAACLEPHQRPDHVTAELARAGILVSTAEAFAMGPHRPRALRLALATPPRSELGTVLRNLRDVLDAIPP
ncbi:hypothetical protein [Streptomyces sp. LN704]|uniref:hypothetical protein n=1 Tax=unclassified Streptomyces TaxID=2593676 RepID=UPI00371EA983